MLSFFRFSLFSFPLVFAIGTAAATPDPVKTRAYIDHAWTTLTRSIDDCTALADPKVKTRSVLYLPADFPRTAKIDETGKRCNVDVRPLPQAIRRIGDFEPRSLPEQGLLYLPKPYVVPGGFFNEMYGWDSYFIILGLIADKREALARDMVDNFLFQVQHYGGVLNANRTYYLTRSQPPFLGEMIRSVLDAPASFPGKQEADAWLARAYPLALRDYADSGTVADTTHMGGLLTVEQLFARVAETIEGRPAQLAVEFDATLGYVTSFQVDQDFAMADEEYSITITEFQPQP